MRIAEKFAFWVKWSLILLHSWDWFVVGFRLWMKKLFALNRSFMDLDINLRDDGESRVVDCRYPDVGWHGQCAGVVLEVLASARYTSSPWIEAFPFP